MECTDSLDEFSKLHTVLCYNLQWFAQDGEGGEKTEPATCLLYPSPSPRDA